MCPEFCNHGQAMPMQHQMADSGPPAERETVRDHIAQAERLCNAIAGRDLGQTPLYVVPQSSLPPACGTASRSYAYTSPSLDLYLAEHIPDYRGRGPCMVVNDLAIAQDYDAEDFDFIVPGFVVHELAHILDRPALFADRTGVDPALIRFESLVVAKADDLPPRTDVPEYFGHGPTFIRVALHLRHRVELAGVRLSPAQLCAGRRYGLSHALQYHDALGDEPERMVDTQIRNILATPPPRAFSSLWCDDFISYHQCFPQTLRSPA